MLASGTLAQSNCNPMAIHSSVKRTACWSDCDEQSMPGKPHGRAGHPASKACACAVVISRIKIIWKLLKCRMSSPLVLPGAACGIMTRNTTAVFSYQLPTHFVQGKNLVQNFSEHAESVCSCSAHIKTPGLIKQHAITRVYTK